MKTRTEPDGPAWRQSIYHPFALTSRYGRGTVLRVEPTGPTYETSWLGEVPTVLTAVGFLKGSNASAGNGTLTVTTTGALQLLYGSGTDMYTYFLHGSYVAGA